MPKSFSLSIKAQLLLMALVVALPVAAHIVYTGIALRQHAIDQAIQESKKLGDAIANEQKQLATSAEQLMSALAQLPDIKTHNAVGARQIFSEILKLNPHFINISVADSTGTLWASAVNVNPLSMSDRRYFKNAMATGRLSSGEYIVSRVTSRPTINLCYPFKNGNNVLAGALIIGFNLDQLVKSVDASELHKYSYLVVDRNGTILNRSINPEKSIGAKDTPKLFKLMQGPHRDGVFVSTGLDGQKRFITYRKVYLNHELSPFMYIRSGVPFDVVVQQANSLLLRNIASFVFSLSLAFLLAWLIGKRSIIEPISRLQEASRRLARGDLQVRVSDVVEGGELGLLGKAFDEMARHLNDRDQERDAAEAALRKSESHYRSIFDNSLFGIAVTGVDKRLVQANDAFCRLLEYERAELVGVKTFSELTHPDDAEESGEMYLKLRKMELSHYTLEKRYLTKSGKVVWALCFVQGFYDDEGAYEGHSACILDVTDLKLSEERMRLFFERQLVGTAITSPAKGWIMSNEKLQRMLGYTGEELARMTWEELTHPADLKRNVKWFDKMLRGEIDSYALEKRFIRKDGFALYTALSVGCVRKYDGTVDYLLVMVQDISQGKEAEEEIRQLNASLERRVTERTRLLEVAMQELESFSYSVSHDLRSPLRHINSYLAIVMDEFEDRFPAEARDYMIRACLACVQMGKLIDGLLELSRVGRTEILKERVDLSALAAEVAVMLRENEPGRAVKVVIAQGLSAQGDKNLLRIVLMNLLGNAWKYTSRKEHPRLEFGETMVDGRHSFFVRDNGAGFDMAYSDKLFGTFQRLHGNEYEGTGIGLATVKRIMERHCGTVWGESAVEEGATFYFSLP